MSGKALMGIFVNDQDLLKAVEALKERKDDCTVFSPWAQESIQEVLKKGPSPVRYYTLFGAILGLCSGFALAVYTVLQWRFVVSGKPIIPWIPFVIIGFEFLILFGVLSTFAGLLIHCRLPRRRLPASYDPRFSEDRMGLLVSYRSPERGKIAGLLKEAGAEEIHDVAG
jgi:hypothetical protein